VQPRLDAEAEDGAVESGLEHRSDHRVGRGGRGDVEGVAGVGERAKDRIEPGMIEILAPGVVVDLYALEVKLTRAAGDVTRRALWVVRRDGGHSVVAVGADCGLAVEV